MSTVPTTSSFDHPRRRSELRAGYRALHEALPDQMQGFAQLHRSAVAAGALPAATKELMAMAIGIVQHCDDCVTLHMHDALRAGATADEVHEAIGVALLMGGGPASTAATTALDALAQFSD
jgi:AhpD family alkylhydroperoxidase